MRFELTNQQSIQKIIDQCNEGDVIILEDGIYEEKIEIWKAHITIQAKHKHQAILSNKDYYHKIMSNHNECNTFNTFTLLVGADNVTLKNLVIENRAIPSHIYGQAVALHVLGTNFQCDNCIIKSAQDTLFTGPLPTDLIKRYTNFYESKRLTGTPSKQIYRHCTIAGDVDFIFGCATALFEHCIIQSISQNKHTPGFICAPAHDPSIPFGYLFYQCKLEGNFPSYLARPWRDFGCAAFIECSIGKHILLEGFNKWGNTNRDQTARFYEYSLNIDTSKRVSWSHQLSFEEANAYLKQFMNYLNC